MLDRFLLCSDWHWAVCVREREGVTEIDREVLDRGGSGLWGVVSARSNTPQ